jgi:hypothetical protein
MTKNKKMILANEDENQHHPEKVLDIFFKISRLSNFFSKFSSFGAKIFKILIFHSEIPLKKNFPAKNSKRTIFEMISTAIKKLKLFFFDAIVIETSKTLFSEKININFFAMKLLRNKKSSMSQNSFLSQKNDRF